MAIRRGHKVSIKANVNTTRVDSIYLDLKEDETRRIRFMPPNRADGALFTKIVNHFRLKTDDNPPRGMAVACNGHFNDEDCYLCTLSKVLKTNGDKAEKKIGDDIRASARFYAPVLVAEKEDDGTWTYHGPKLLGLPKTAVEDINAILLQQDMAGDDFFCDADKGQDILITRTGTGFNTKYKASATGQKNKLDDIFSDWEEKFIDSVDEVVGLNFLAVEDQKSAAVRTFGDDLDWDALSEDFNL
jgi:hypothetical protein